MKKSFIVSLVAAIAVIFSFGSAYAVYSPIAETTILVEADSDILEEAAAASDLEYTSVAGESLAANDIIVVTLTGGATFSGVAVTMTPNDLGVVVPGEETADLGGGVNLPTAPLSGGGAGDTTATWRSVGPIEATSTLTLNSSDDIFDLTGVASGSSVNVTMYMETSTGHEIGSTRSVHADVDNYLFVVNDSYTVTQDDDSDIADVQASTGIYTRFTGDTLVSSASVLSITNDTSVNTIPASTPFLDETIVIALEGDFTGIASIAATGVTGTIIGSTSTGNTADGTAGFFLINDDRTAAYAVNNGDLDAAETLQIAPVFTLDGTTQQTARAFTSSIEVLAQSDWDAFTMQSATTQHSITRNGAQFYAPRMVSRGTYTSYLFLKSDATASADVILELVNAAGETATINVTVPAAADGGALTISAADLLADPATSGWTATGPATDFSIAVTIALPVANVTIDGSVYNATTTDNNVMTIYQDAGRIMEY